MKKNYLLIFIGFLFLTISANEKLSAQTTVFSDDFSTNTSATYTTSGAIGASAWSVLVPNADWGARRNTSPQQLELTNDASATANVIGWVLASTPTSSFLSPYNTTLSSNTGAITWTFNMRQIRTDPAGFGAGSYGVAYILAGTSTTNNNTGTGYAIVLGQSGTTDAVRLAKYNNGIQGTLTNIITSNTTGLTDFGAEYLSIRVIYTPSTNTWELLLRNDGATAFADPASGTLVSQGTAVDNTYTGVSLGLMGAWWQGSTTANQTAFFDNVSVIVGPASQNVSIAAGTNAYEGGTNGNFTITISPVTTSAITVNYDLPVPGNATFTTDYGATLTSTPVAGVTPATLVATSGTLNVPSGVTTVTVTFAAVDDALTEGPEPIVMTLSSPSGGYTLGTPSSTIVIVDNEPFAIHDIQGSGPAAIPGIYTVRAIVIGVYPTLSPAGFYIEEPNADWDADPNTSEGIFVVSAASVSVGDDITVTGTAQENASTPSFNQAVLHTTTTVSVNSTGNPLPSTVDITLPVTAITDYEKYEAMLVRFPGTLTVSDNNALGNFGEVSLSAGGLVYQSTQVVDPNDNPPSGTTSTGNSNGAAVTAYTLSNTLRTILLDDGRGSTATLPYVNVDNTLRVGSTIDNISGILGYAFSKYRIQPTPSFSSITFNHAARPAVPGYGAANLKVVSLNVLNYFNGDGAGGGFPTTRGANSLAEFNRQRDKIISAITQMNADVLGLIEMENDGTGATSAIQDLVNGLNNVLGAGTYSIINDGTTIQTGNTDQIRCGIIYKSTVVTPVGAAMLGSDPVFNRPPLAQTFNLISTNKNFNFIVNHFKSKGGTGTGLDADMGDGQSAFNNTRKLQANALLTFINSTVIPTSGTDRILSVGDYNAYFEEDPMDILRAGTYTVLGSSATYSFLFSGQLGSLDHAVISPSLAGTVTAFSKWNANSVEPEYLDYNDAILDPGGDVVNPWASTYTVSPWRSGDHDAIVMGLFLDAVLPVTLVNFSAIKENASTKISWTTAQEINSRNFIIERSVNGGSTWEIIAMVAASGNSNTNTTYTAYDRNPSKGINLYRLKSVDLDNKFNYSAIRRVSFDSKYTFSIYPNPVADILQINVDNAAGMNANIQVISSQGQVLISKQINSITQPAQVDVSSLSAGMYFIKILTADGTLNMQKFIKK